VIESIELTELDAQDAAVIEGRCAAEDIGAFVGPAYEEVAAALGRAGLGPSGPPFCRYAMGGSDGMDRQGHAPVFVLAAGFPATGPLPATGRVVAVRLAGGSAVVALHVGAYDELGEASRAVESWMSEHGLEPAGDPWETYLDGPDASPHRTRLTCPCAPTA
jgi:effector-binding domain-containing protein